jgi:predicted flap endonuclease-1-like 5' DNA nuclease
MRRFTKIGSVLVGIGAGAAAVVWLIKDRLLGPESKPVGPEEAPAFRVAPADTPAAPEAGSDDLSDVKGIGPVYRARLEQAGIATFAGLIEAGPDRVAEAAGVTAERAGEWLAQAAALTS